MCVWVSLVSTWVDWIAAKCIDKAINNGFIAYQYTPAGKSTGLYILQGSSNKSRHGRGLHTARGSTRNAKSSEQDLGNLIAMLVSIEFHGYQLNSTAINKTGIKAYPQI